MVTKIDFFKQETEEQYLENLSKGGSVKPHLTEDDKMKIYECLQYRVFKRGETMCKFGEVGDRFFIILKGQVGILVP